jgi:hypothetical protein
MASSHALLYAASALFPYNRISLRLQLLQLTFSV